LQCAIVDVSLHLVTRHPLAEPFELVEGLRAGAPVVADAVLHGGPEGERLASLGARAGELGQVRVVANVEGVGEEPAETLDFRRLALPIAFLTPLFAFLSIVLESLLVVLFLVASGALLALVLVVHGDACTRAVRRGHRA